MQGEAEILRRVRLEQHGWAFDENLRFAAVEVGAELQAHQVRERGAFPFLLEQDVVRRRERLQARVELLEEALHRAGVARGLSRHRLDHGEQVLRAVGEFPHQKAQLDLILLALRDVARGGEDALQRAVPVVEGGRVVGHLRLLAVEGARRQLVVGDLLLAQHELDRRFGPLRFREVALERRADQLVARAAGERLHLLVDVRDDAGGVGGHQRVDVGFDQRAGVELLVAQALIKLLLFCFDQLALGDFALQLDVQRVGDFGEFMLAQ